MRLATEMGRRRTTPIRTSSLSKSTTPNPSPTVVPKQKEKVIVISGPTGAGKSRLALDLAKRLDGEIISADSVQVYRGLDVGAAKPSLSDQREVPHHLINILNPSEDYSAGQFFEDARNATDEVLSKGKVPLVVGGTGLYLRWFIYGKPEAPAASVNVTSEVSSELTHFQEKGQWDEAVEVVVSAGDPNARELPLNNWYRLRRRLEIIRSSGSPPSAFAVPYDSFKEQTNSEQGQSVAKDLDYDFIFFFLTCTRVDLYRAIDLRCEKMLMEAEGGLLSEASWLLDIGLRPDMNSATRAIGYRQAMEYLLECRNDAGRITADCFLGFLHEFQKTSRNFARRQLTWFRNESLYQWIDSSMPLENLVDFVYSAYKEQTEKLLVPNHLQMKKTNDKLENYELKTYRTQNQIFRNESDCRHVLDWVERTQRRSAV
ncbi:tRNA dimethylallyltransferase 9 [Platanthera zijinensis]|uniref:tRNA dimethylallyltransferase n=1 Tax=Platanthera zijinensis TaxID=2320716 RepID=A0AAP0BDB3_9ASPA